jgi:hypothetical protein
VGCGNRYSTDSGAYQQKCSKHLGQRNMNVIQVSMAPKCILSQWFQEKKVPTINYMYALFPATSMRQLIKCRSARNEEEKMVKRLLLVGGGGCLDRVHQMMKLSKSIIPLSSAGPSRKAFSPFYDILKMHALRCPKPEKSHMLLLL